MKIFQSEAIVEPGCPHCTERTFPVSKELGKIVIGGSTVDVADITQREDFQNNRDEFQTYRPRHSMARDLFSVHSEDPVETIKTYEDTYRYSLYEIGRLVVADHYDNHARLNSNSDNQQTQSIANQEKVIVEKIVLHDFLFATLFMDAIHLANVIDHRKKGFEGKVIRKIVANKFQVEEGLLHNVQTHLPNAAEKFAENITTQANESNNQLNQLQDIERNY